MNRSRSTGRRRTTSAEMARLTLLIHPQEKLAFDALCASLDLSTSQVVRSLIAQFMERHAVAAGAAARD